MSRFLLTFSKSCVILVYKQHPQVSKTASLKSLGVACHSAAVSKASVRFDA